MRRLTIRLAAFAALTMTVTGCGLIQIPLPDIDITSWFGEGGTITGTAVAGEFDPGEVVLERLDDAALGRGGLTLAGLRVEEGLADTNVSPAILGVSESLLPPAMIEVSIYLSVSSFGGLYLPSARLVRATIDLVDNGDGTYSFSGPFDVGSQDQDVLAIAIENDPFYAALVVRVLDENGDLMEADCIVTIEGLVAKPKYVL